MSIRGKLIFLIETGHEGSPWAFQDEAFITPNTNRFKCNKCFLFWNKEAQPGGPDEISNFSGSDNSPDSCIGQPQRCAAGEHDFALYPAESWSYEGLSILEDNDHLTVFDPDNLSVILWEGTLDLEVTLQDNGQPFFAGDRNAEQGEWVIWFLNKYPAQLRKAQ